jgi:photosystem II stability/assembly factor-like uncharacterized protein
MQRPAAARIGCILRVVLRLCVLLVGFLPVAAQTWRPLGPPGGDVRTLTRDPHDPDRLYLGTADGHLFLSQNAGQSWVLLSRVGGDRTDHVLTHILVDPRNPHWLYASAWSRQTGGGGVFRSRDRGHSWELVGLGGENVRALAQSASHPDVLIAGSLTGVFRSRNSGQSWERISPAGHPEIRNVDSVAIDPRNPDLLYVGTFHLPWKSNDGGRTWFPIHAGMIDDSDVFSIAIDPTDPRRVYASACSGIYRSDNAGLLWKKVQGIPYSARRTHVIRLDPTNARIVYAGTTEGLWKSVNAGASWRRLTPQNWVINALEIDPRNPTRLLVGTEQLGVQASDDGGETFRASNDGFSHRQILALALDSRHPGRMLAVLAHAPEPVLVTEDGGRSWAPLGRGLQAEGVLRVYAAPDGWWAALQEGGLVRYDESQKLWIRTGTVVGEAALRQDHTVRSNWTRRPARREPLVLDLAFSRDRWFAATPEGLLVSADSGRTWERFPFAPLPLPVSSVRVSPDGQHLWVVSLRGMVFSRDGGRSWTWHDLPFDSGGALRLEVADADTLLAIARRGLYVSRDAGRTWQLAASGLPTAPLQELAIVGNVWLASLQTGGLYLSFDRGFNWMRVEGLLADGFFPVVASMPGASIIYAASSTDGLYAIEFPHGAQVAEADGQPD